MTRRILLVLLAFTAAVIAGAMVPLALNTIGHDRSSFVQATAGMVRTDAAVAQASLDGSPDQPLLYLLNEVQQAGDGLLILKSHRILNSAGQPQIAGNPAERKGQHAGPEPGASSPCGRMSRPSPRRRRTRRPSRSPRRRDRWWSPRYPSTSAAKARWWAR